MLLAEFERWKVKACTKVGIALLRKFSPPIVCLSKLMPLNSVSANARAQFAQQAAASGMDSFMSKPYSREEVSHPLAQLTSS